MGLRSLAVKGLDDHIDFFFSRVGQALTAQNQNILDPIHSTASK
jgi:hypothetical protein